MGKLPTCCGLVVYVTDLLWGNWRNGFWEKLLGKVANLLQSCYELVVYVADLIATQWGSRQLITDFYRLANNCYGETGVMAFILQKINYSAR